MSAIECPRCRWRHDDPAESDSSERGFALDSEESIRCQCGAIIGFERYLVIRYTSWVIGSDG
jgi:hypothetical protein